MQSRKTYVLFILVCLIFGTTFLAISLGLNAGASPLFFAALRFTIAGSLMTTLLLVKHRIPLTGFLSLAARAALLSLFLTAGTFGCMFIAQTRVDSGLAARLDATGPLLTAIFASLLLGKKLKFPHFLAFAFGTCGSFLIASPAARAELTYVLLAAVSIILYALGNAIYPRLFRKDEDPIVVSALQSLAGGLILLILALMTESIEFPVHALGPLLYLILAGSIFAHTATLVLVRDAGPVFASSWCYVAPVVATVFGALVLNEQVGWAGISGTILSLVGVFLLDLAERQNSKNFVVNKNIQTD